MKETLTDEEREARKRKYTRFLRVQTIGVVNIDLIKDFMVENKLYFADFCHKCGVNMWNMRNILLNYHRPSPLEDFYKIAEFIGVSIDKLFEGISEEAKRLLKLYQKNLPCKI